MKLAFSELKYVSRLSLVWLLLNVLLNITGLFITKIISGSSYIYLQSILRDFTHPLFYQFIMFVAITIIVAFLKNFKLSNYIFPALQFLIFNILFLTGLKFNGGMHFESTFTDFGIQYMSKFGQYLVDTFYLIYPMPGMFDEGMFIPASTGMFYLHWVLLNSVYYFALSWLTDATDKFFFGKYTEV
jgi:hypothetical protein